MRILFICHGNICRSPMAEYIMKELVKQEGVAGDWEIESAAVSREEIGNPVYPPARRKLLGQGIPCGQHAARSILGRLGISCAGKTARQMTREDYNRYDYLIGMDSTNLRNMYRICGGDPDGKLHLLLDFTDRKGEEVADPWYTGDFDAVWEDLLEGCQALLREYR